MQANWHASFWLPVQAFAAEEELEIALLVPDAKEEVEKVLMVLVLEEDEAVMVLDLVELAVLDCMLELAKLDGVLELAERETLIEWDRLGEDFGGAAAVKQKKRATR